MASPRVTVLEAPWGDQDAALLSVFLHDLTGQKFIMALKERLPRVTVDKPAETGLVHAGFQQCLDEIVKLQSRSKPAADATNPTWAHSKEA